MSDIPYNVIIIEEQPESIAHIIDDYIGLLERCISYDEQRITLKMFADELSLIIADELIRKQISKNLEVLEELRNAKIER